MPRQNDVVQQALRRLIRNWYEQEGDQGFREMAKRTGRSNDELEAVVASIKAEQEDED